MTAKTFIKNGNTVRVRDKETVKAYDDLPVGTYAVKYDDRAGEFFLELIEDFTLPKKIYGKNIDYSNRILRTFQDRPGQTGVLLSGIKGAGKTLLAKQTAVHAASLGIPTIVINRDWHGDEFNTFIQSIVTPAIIIFDEFEKIYDWNTQRKILTLLDGVFNSRKLFIITTNEEREVSEYMRNRPGRIFYNFTFDTLGQDFIQEYLEDRLVNKDHIDGILRYTKVFSFFNFDMLAAVVEEMNRYGETITQVLEILNIKPENRESDTFKVELVVDESSFVLDKSYINFHPNNFEYYLWTDEENMVDALRENKKVCKTLKTVMKRQVHDTNDNTIGDDYIQFNPLLIKEFNQENNTFVYSIDRHGCEIQLHVTRNDPIKKWSYNPNAF